MTDDARRESAPGQAVAKTPHSDRRGAMFWLSAAVGWAIIAVGVRGVFANDGSTKPPDLFRWAVGGALIHDLLVAPLVIGIAVALRRVVRGSARSILQAALVVTAAVALFSWPLIRAYGLALENPSSLPHNYAANLAVVLGIVWAIAAAGLLWRMRA